MNDFLSLAAQSSPDRLALITSDVEITYGELNQRVADLSSRLDAAGIQAKDRVAVLLDRGLASVELVHALARRGAVIVPLNTRLTPTEMRWQIEQADSRWTLSALPAPLLEEAILLDDLPPEGEPDQWLGSHFELDTDFGILFTSGTTGKPKGAVLTWGNIFWSATASAFRLGVLPSDRWLLTLPLYHIGGLAILFRSALYGTAVVLPDYPSDQFDLEQLWRKMQEAGVTLVSLVSTMLYRLMDRYEKENWPLSLRLILLGGAAATPELLQAARDANLPVAVTYGLTEATSQVATADPELTRLKPGTVGKPLQWSQMSIHDKDGHPLPTGKIGEVWVQGPMVMRGYLHQATGNDWLHTGDLGYLDDEGDLWIVQRRSDLIISGGENIYPAEIEAVIRQHPAVKDACVVGLPNAEWGQQVAAAITLRPDASLDEKSLLSFCRQHLASFKLPRQIIFLDTLPRTSSGKIQRNKVIREMTHLSSVDTDDFRK
ncbi:MAG: o-succinylbenzoate--CoA ligase [Anaerolineae bacterium]|nr:o-succinylbenzoate--CoA ligase [Anaerolineae bacterium]